MKPNRGCRVEEGKPLHMKPSLRLLLCLIALTFAAAVRADDPSGTWTFQTKGLQDGEGGTSTLELRWENNILSGTITNRAGETSIRDASFADGRVRFTVKRRIRVRSIEIHYDGLLEGDTIKGTIQGTAPRKKKTFTLPWTAERVK